jgi:inner membrane protein
MTIDNKWKNSAGLKLIAIAVLIGLLLVPANAIKSLIREREQSQQDVIEEISDMWGGEQVITGPVLTVPFTKKVKDDKGVLTTITQNAYFLPDELSVKSELSPEIRYRGIYKVVVYTAQLHLDGSFVKPDFESLSVPRKTSYGKMPFLLWGFPA